MSTKTLRKRIALVAVAALGAGVLSVAPASAVAGNFGVLTGTTYCSAKDAALATVALTGDVRYITVPVGSYTTVAPSDAVQDVVYAGTGGNYC